MDSDPERPEVPGPGPEPRRADPLTAIQPPVGPDDRLTVRYRLPDGSATDVLGWVVAIDDERVRMVSRPDRRTTVDRSAIILAKRVPPAMGGRAPSRYSPAELERAAVTAWLADAEPLGEWILRSGAGFTGRANSCLAVGDPGVPYERAATILTDFYTGRSLPPLAQVVAGSEEERELRRIGWQDSYVPTTVLAQPLAGLIGDHPPSRLVRIDDTLTEDWWQAYLRYRPVPDPEVARRILNGVPPVGLASVRDPDGSVIAFGRGQVSADWLGLSAMWTDPAHRRRGLATMIMRQLGRWAARHGARNVYLQVARGNSVAVAAYAGLGFRAHHDYGYLAPGDQHQRDR